MNSILAQPTPRNDIALFTKLIAGFVVSAFIVGAFTFNALQWLQPEIGQALARAENAKAHTLELENAEKEQELHAIQVENDKKAQLAQVEIEQTRQWNNQVADWMARLIQAIVAFLPVGLTILCVGLTCRVVIPPLLGQYLAIQQQRMNRRVDQGTKEDRVPQPLSVVKPTAALEAGLPLDVGIGIPIATTHVLGRLQAAEEKQLHRNEREWGKKRDAMLRRKLNQKEQTRTLQARQDAPE